MRAPIFIIIFAGGIMVAGCAVGPNYKRPRIAVENHYAELTPANTTNAPPAEWWKSFHDPELDQLIATALRQNFDLQIATERLRESRFQRNIVAADLFPQVDADAGYAITRGSSNVKLPLGGSSSGGSSGSSSGSGSGGPAPVAHAQMQSSGGSSAGNGSVANNTFNNQLSPLGKGGLPGVTTELYQAGFDASWEIDVFGGKRRAVEAATAQIAAANEGRHDMMVTLLAEVARNYLDLRGTQRRLQIADDNLAAQKEILELTRSKRKAGLATGLEVTRAAAQTATTAADIPPLRARLKQLTHALSILLAEEPNALGAELEKMQPLPATPPEVPVGLPSQLVERRPDIRQAERDIAAANAQIGVARADLFPKFALVASTGLDSSQSQNLFDWGSRYFLLSPTVTWRIFDAGQILANINLQKANQEEAVLQYHSTILKALQEVEDALVAYATEQMHRADLNEAFNQDRQSLDLARQQYDYGLVDFLNVLDAERTVYAADDQLAQSNQTITTDLVALYKALGGGWK
jgi:multidrug efflux system outer membrane protein